MKNSKFNKLFNLIMEEFYSYNLPGDNQNLTVNADLNNNTVDIPAKIEQPAPINKRKVRTPKKKNYSFDELKQLPPNTRVLGEIGFDGENDYEKCSDVQTVENWLKAFKALQDAEIEEDREITIQLGPDTNYADFSIDELKEQLKFKVITPAEEQKYEEYSQSQGGLYPIFDCEYF